jgi:hypothetical protein
MSSWDAIVDDNRLELKKLLVERRKVTLKESDSKSVITLKSEQNVSTSSTSESIGVANPTNDTASSSVVSTETSTTTEEQSEYEDVRLVKNSQLATRASLLLRSIMPTNFETSGPKSKRKRDVESNGFDKPPAKRTKPKTNNNADEISDKKDKKKSSQTKIDQMFSPTSAGSSPSHEDVNVLDAESNNTSPSSSKEKDSKTKSSAKKKAALAKKVTSTKQATTKYTPQTTKKTMKADKTATNGPPHSNNESTDEYDDDLLAWCKSELKKVNPNLKDLYQYSNSEGGLKAHRPQASKAILVIGNECERLLKITAKEFSDVKRINELKEHLWHYVSLYTKNMPGEKVALLYASLKKSKS